jgi:predicted nucleic acid-binding protein
VTGDERGRWSGFADQAGRSPPVGGSTARKLTGAADRRAIIAQQLIEAGGIIGVQQLNEFVSVARRKLRRSWKEVLTALEDMRILCPDPIPISLGMHDASLGIAERYGFSIYDSLVIVAALEADCDTLYSEDMQSGQDIDGLTIRNPF